MPELTIGFYIWAMFTLLISLLNSISVGAFWSEKENLPTELKVQLWAGAVMAACGFFAVFIFPVTYGMVELHGFEFYAAFLKIGLEPTDIPAMVEVIFSIAYLLIIFPVLGSGFVIWTNSLVVAYKRRTFGSVAVAGWNSYAQIRNTVSAFRNVPEVLEVIGKFFEGKSGRKLLVWAILILIPVAISLGAAVFTTWTIMKLADNKFQLDEVAAR